MAIEQIKKREYLSRAKTVYKQLKKLQRQITKEQRQKNFLSEIGVSDNALEQEIESNIQRYKETIKKKIALDEEIQETILTVHNDTLEIILIRHYILCESSLIIAEKMNYDERHICRLLRQAIDKIIIPEVEETA
ncbi:MAG: hypothetical protein K2K06_07545 [Oscillospiraceae bacterium]|nr:hypothetical protein [Oscillospiraceae bacterium]